MRSKAASPAFFAASGVQRLRNRPGYRAVSPLMTMTATGEAAANLGIQLTELHPDFGVRVEGLDLTQSLSRDQQDFLVAALDEKDVLLFRGDSLRPAHEANTLLAFPHDEQAVKDQQWTNAFFHLRAPEAPLIAVRGKNVDLKDHFGLTTDDLAPGKARDLETLKTTHLWHMDQNDRLYPPGVCSMYMHIVPENGGETLFADTTAFLESLSAEELQHLESLKVSSVRQTLGPMSATNMKLNYEGTMRLDDLDGDIEKAASEGTLKQPEYEPLIVQDQRTGKKSMVMSPWTVHDFEGMGREESRQLAASLVERCCTSERIIRHKWQKHDFLIWANRRVLHSATPHDVYANDQRLFHLAFLNSKEPKMAASQAA